MKKILMLLFFYIPVLASAQEINYPMPNPGTSSFNEYAAQIANPIDSLNLSKERTKYAGYISELKKIYYTNGITVTDIFEHEYQAESITIPNITIQQAYKFLQNIVPLQAIYPIDKSFPEKNYTEAIGKPWNDRNITITRNGDGIISKVEIYADMECRSYLTFISLPGEVVISYECAL